MLIIMQSSLGATAKWISIALIRTAFVAAPMGINRTSAAIPAADGGAAAVAAVNDIIGIPILLIYTNSCSCITNTRMNQMPYKVLYCLYVKVIIIYKVASNVSLQCFLKCIRVWHTLKTKQNFQLVKSVYKKFYKLTESFGVHILT